MKIEKLRLEVQTNSYLTNNFKQQLWLSPITMKLRKEGFRVNDWFEENYQNEKFVELLIKKIWSTFHINIINVVKDYVKSNLDVNQYFVSDMFKELEAIEEEKVAFLFYMKSIKGCYYEVYAINQIKKEFPNDEFESSKELDNKYKIDLIRKNDKEIVLYQIKSYVPNMSSIQGKKDMKEMRKKMNLYNPNAIKILLTPYKQITI